MRKILVALSAVSLLLAPSPADAQPAACIIETLAGGEDTPSGDGGPALSAELVPTDIAHGPDGALYIADFGHWSIRRIRLDGVIERVAGTGKSGYGADGTPALAASIQPRYLAFDASGDLLFTDRGQVRKITGGVIVTVAGNGSTEFSGDGGPAMDAGIGSTPIIAAEPDGSILVAQADHFRIRRVTPNGIIQTIAGLGANTSSGDGGPAVNAEIGSPRAIAIAPDGSTYFWAGVADSNRPGVRRIRLDGIIESHSPYFRSIGDLEFAPDGDLFAIASDVYQYVGNEWIQRADLSARAISASTSGELVALVYFDNQVFRIDQDDLTLVAGAGRQSPHGEGGLAFLAYVSEATGVSVAQDGSVYYADPGLGRIRRITPGGMMERVVPDFEEGFPNVNRVAVATDGVVYALRPLAGLSSLQAIALDGTVSTIPVTSGIPPRPVNLDDIEADKNGNLFLTYTRSAVQFLRVIGASPTNITLPSRATGEFAIGPDGRAFVAAGQGDWRSVAPNGQTESIPGLTGFAGELFPRAVAAGPDGSLYWSSRTAIWRMLPDQAIDQIAGGAEAGYEGDNGPAKDGQFTVIEEMTFGPDGRLYIAERDRIRRITSPHECPSAGPRPKIATYGVVNSADYRGLSPGAVFALFGASLGPQEFVGAVLDQNGKLPTELGGTRVLFDGVPAPLLFSSTGQVNGIVPFGAHVMARYDGSGTPFFPGGPVYAVVERNGAVSDQAGLLIYESWPGIFTRDSSGKGLAAAINEDASINGSDNPAAPGSVVVLWATGAGLTDLPQQDGSINSSPLAQPLLPVTVQIGGVPVTVEYAGAAPGLVAGVIQINVRIPANFNQSGELPVVLKVAASPPTAGSNLPTIYVGQ